MGLDFAFQQNEQMLSGRKLTLVIKHSSLFLLYRNKTNFI